MFENNENEAEVKIQSPSRVTPLIGVLLILLSIAGYTFLTGPLSEKLDEAKANLLEKEVEIAALGGQLDQFETAKVELGLGSEVSKNSVLKAVPADMDQDRIIRDLVEVADVHDIELHSLSFGEGASGKEGVNVLRINASFEGNYTDLTDFLQGLEQNARMLRVNSINVQIDVLDVGDIKRATFSLAMEAFFQDK